MLTSWQILITCRGLQGTATYISNPRSIRLSLLPSLYQPDMTDACNTQVMAFIKSWQIRGGASER